MLVHSCLGALLTQTWEVFNRAGALNVLYRSCTFCKQACMHDILNAHSWPATGNSKAWQPTTTRLFEKYDIGAPEYMSVRGISIMMLNKWMKCATKTQSLLTAMPCSHKSHMITLVTIHDFIFQLSMISLTHFEDFTTMKMAAHATAARAHNTKHQSNHHRTKSAAGSQILMWRYKWISNGYVGAAMVHKFTSEGVI